MSRCCVKLHGHNNILCFYKNARIFRPSLWLFQGKHPHDKKRPNCGLQQAQHGKCFWEQREHLEFPLPPTLLHLPTLGRFAIPDESSSHQPVGRSDDTLFLT